MNTIVGASGQVGSAVVFNLLKNRKPVKGVVRNEKKAGNLKKAGAAVVVADIHDKQALTASFKNTTSVFVLTPETGSEPDIIADTRSIVQNYREAVEQSPVKKIVALSSIGAQYESGTGNLQMSYLLEHAFAGLPLEKIFIRPAYYFSNWLAYTDTVKKDGVLPTFFPPDFSLSMISPLDVAEIVADIMADNISVETKAQTVYELEGPAWYSSKDVADAFAEILGRNVTVQQIEREAWAESLKPLGFSEDGIKNFIEMTEAVISGKVLPEKSNTVSIRGKTSLREYMRSQITK